MARKKTTKGLMSVKTSLARRLREVREEIFGEHGGPELARRLGLPARTWYNYETGVTVPAEVLLRFIDQTGVDPAWLLTGERTKYHRCRAEMALSALSPIGLIRHGLERLQEQSGDVVIAAPENLPGEVMSEFVAVSLVPLGSLLRKPIDPSAVDGYIMAYRSWLPNASQTVGVRLLDDAMHPILPSGSLVAIDRSITDPERLDGWIVAACPEGVPVVRRLEIAGRHLVLRPDRPSPEYPLIPVESGNGDIPGLIIGRVIWSWSLFGEP